MVARQSPIYQAAERRLQRYAPDVAGFMDENKKHYLGLAKPLDRRYERETHEGMKKRDLRESTAFLSMLARSHYFLQQETIKLDKIKGTTKQKKEAEKGVEKLSKGLHRIEQKYYYDRFGFKIN